MNNKKEFVTIRLSEQDKQLLIAKAAENYQKPTSYARKKLMEAMKNDNTSKESSAYSANQKARVLKTMLRLKAMLLENTIKKNEIEKEMEKLWEELQ